MLSPARRLPLVHRVRHASSKVPTPRPGRNLTERYRTLEHTDRAKSERVSHISQSSASAAELQPDAPAPARTIAGLVVPEEPLAPADDECCMSGCAVCVYDLYEAALVAYKDSVTTPRAALSARHIPETEWPAHIRSGAVRETQDAVLGAFEEMERALKEKRDKRAAVEAEKRARGDVLEGDVELDLRGVLEGIRWIVFPSR